MKMQTTGRILVHGLFRRWDLIVFLNVAILGTILVGSWLWPPSYKATSSIVILGRSYTDLLTPAKGTGPSTLIMNPKEEINTEIEIIRSRPVLERVVRDLHLDQKRTIPEKGVAGAIRTGARAVYRAAYWVLTSVGVIPEYTPSQKFEAAVNRLRKRLVVVPAADSQIIWIKYSDPDPERAAKVVNHVDQEYQKQHLAININRAESSFYGEQIEKVQGELKGLQEELLHLKERDGIVSFPEQSRAILKKLEVLDNSRTNVQKEIIRIQSMVDKIDDLRKAKPQLLIPLPELAQDQQLSDLENKLINLNFQVKSVLQRYNPESRQYRTILGQIGHLRWQIRHQVSTLLERQLAKLRELQAEEQAIDQTIKNMGGELEKLPMVAMNLGNLEREIDTKEAILAVLLKKYQDTLLAQKTDRRLENAKILSAAAVPLKPSFPILWLNLVLGLIFSVVLSLSLVFLLEYWDDSLKIPEDVERYLDRSVFASIPEL